MRLKMQNRLRKLEARNMDATGFKPHTEAWFTFWEDKFFRLMDGENIGNVRIPIAVTDRMIARSVAT